MSTRENILSAVNAAKSISWEALKAKLDYREFPKMMENVRALEREEKIHRIFVKNKDGRGILHVNSGKAIK